MTNFLIADDHGIVRSGIRAMIKKNFIFSRLDQAEDGDEIANCVKSYLYDVILLDIELPNTNFVTLIGWLKTISPGTRILVFTMHSEEVYGKHCLQLGADGFLSKAASDEEIIFAIRKLVEGVKYISTTLEEILNEDEREKKVANPFLNLSSRELEIANLLNKGRSLPEISTALNIQYSTANTYKRRILEKLSIRNVISLAHLMQTYNISP